MTYIIVYIKILLTIYATIYSCMMEERIIPIHEQIVQLNIYWIHMREHTWWKPQPSCVIFTNHLDSFLAWNLLFLYLTNEVEFGQVILQGCVSSYHLHVWFFWVNLDDFFAVVCMSFHEVCGLHWYIPKDKIVILPSRSYLSELLYR